MCNEYARRKNLQTLAGAFGQGGIAPFKWRDGLLPNDMDGKASVRISDTAPVVRWVDDAPTGEMMTWAWKGAHGKPVFNFVSEGRDFSSSERVLVFADGFYEYTPPAAPKVRLKDRHLFELKGEPWFWVAGVVRDGAFSLLTTTPGPDIAPYHDRQIVILPPATGLHWLRLDRPQTSLLAPLPADTLNVTTLRRDGVDLAA